MSATLSIEKGVAATGAIPMWRRIIELTLQKAAPLLPPGSEVLEVGYGDGVLTCYLAKHYGWRITGFDSSREAHETANRNAHDAGVSDSVDLRLVEPEETWRITGKYHGVFIKTVLYHAEDLNQYGEWLDWVDSVLKDDGVFINLENGKANPLTYFYRKLRRRHYADMSLYDGEIERLYDDRFDTLYRAHFGSISQFLAPLAPVYHAVAKVEETLVTRTANNSFVTTMVTRKKSRLARTLDRNPSRDVSSETATRGAIHGVSGLLR